MSLLKCRNCIHFEEEVRRNENGEKEYKLCCDMTGKEIPDYNASPESYCYAFKWSSDAWREYAE